VSWRHAKNRGGGNQKDVAGKAIPRVYGNNQGGALLPRRLTGYRDPVQTAPMGRRIHFQLSLRWAALSRAHSPSSSCSDSLRSL
jgi:hypothetical protein